MNIIITVKFSLTALQTLFDLIGINHCSITVKLIECDFDDKPIVRYKAGEGVNHQTPLSQLAKARSLIIISQIMLTWHVGPKCWNRYYFVKNLDKIVHKIATFLLFQNM